MHRHICLEVEDKEKQKGRMVFKNLSFCDIVKIHQKMSHSQNNAQLELKLSHQM